MKVELKNLSWIFCLMLLVLGIAFSAEGVIDRLDSQDASDPTDDDEIYHAGQAIQLVVTAPQEGGGLDGTIQIKSQLVEYDSGVQKLNDVGGGNYTYVWNTIGLQEAEDYTVNATLTSITGAINAPPLIITIDNDPPTDLKLSINHDNPTTSLRSVFLSVSAQDPHPGPLPEGEGVSEVGIVVNLTDGDGEKKIFVKFRDDALNESLPAQAIILLDRLSPQDFSVVIEGEEYCYPVRYDVGGIPRNACGGVSEVGRGGLFDQAL